MTSPQRFSKLTIEYQGEVLGTWVARTKRGFSKAQRKQIEEVRDHIKNCEADKRFEQRVKRKFPHASPNEIIVRTLSQNLRRYL